MKRLIIAISVFLVTTAVSAGELRLDIRGSNGKPLSDAVVWAVPAGPAPQPRRATAVMDQKNRTFVPHVLPVQRGTSVRFPNSDNVRHQVYSFSPPKTFQLPLYIGEPANPVVFDKSGVVSIGCNIHDQMSAWIVVVDTPHFGKSAADGTVVLSGLNPGDFRIWAWHPRIAEENEPVEVALAPDETRTITLRLRTN